MTYVRVIPRDLFNESNLLKCLGRLYLLTERYPRVKMIQLPEGEPFRIEQDPSDGSIHTPNIYLMAHQGGCSHQIRFYRPLNSRDPWPLYATHLEETFTVFTEDGDLTEEFKKALNV